MRKKTMGWEFTIRKSDAARVHYERKSAGIRVECEKRAMA